MFLAPNFLGGRAPGIFESIYKTDIGSDHVAKFRGDRPRELGDLAAKKKKHHEHFIRPPVTPYGRPKQQRQPLFTPPHLSNCVRAHTPTYASRSPRSFSNRSFSNRPPEPINLQRQAGPALAIRRPCSNFHSTFLLPAPLLPFVSSPLVPLPPSRREAAGIN